MQIRYIALSAVSSLSICCGRDPVGRRQIVPPINYAVTASYCGVAMEKFQRVIAANRLTYIQVADSQTRDYWYENTGCLSILFALLAPAY